MKETLSQLLNPIWLLAGAVLLVTLSCGGDSKPEASPTPQARETAPAAAQTALARLQAGLATAAATITKSTTPAPATPQGPALASGTLPTATQAAAVITVAPVVAPPSNVTITFVTTPVRPGDPARLTASVPPGDNCSITYTAPGGALLQLPGLQTALADTSGFVQWSWTIPASPASGTATVKVTCRGQSATAQITISP